MMLGTKECLRVCTGRHTHTQVAGVRGVYQPHVPCVSVYVDRDQRWVLKHLRPLLSPQPQH